MITLDSSYPIYGMEIDVLKVIWGWGKNPKITFVLPNDITIDGCCPIDGWHSVIFNPKIMILISIELRPGNNSAENKS